MQASVSHQCHKTGAFFYDEDAKKKKKKKKKNKKKNQTRTGENPTRAHFGAFCNRHDLRTSEVEQKEKTKKQQRKRNSPVAITMCKAKL
jgi:hypothetical protein